MNSDLQQLAETLAHGDDFESLVRPLLTLLKRISGLESVYLTRIDTGAEFQQILYADNEPTFEIPEGLRVPWQDTLCKRALDEGRYLTTDVSHCWGDVEAARELDIQTYASVPVHRLDQQLFGTLCAASSRQQALDNNLIEVLHLCAEIIALNVERQQRAIDAEQRAEHVQSRLNRVQLARRVTNACLGQSSLSSALVEVTSLLTEDTAWSGGHAFRVSGGLLDPLSAPNAHWQALAEQVLQGDEDVLQLIIKRQEHPILWADPEEQVQALIVCSDHAVEAVLLVELQQSIRDCADSLHVLASAVNSLSLLAVQLAVHARLEAANQVLEQHALHDALTGLPNRRYLIEALDEKMSEAERLEIPLYIAFIDLDGFKQLNDNYGHDMGDLFLQRFTERLVGVLRGHDLIARYGGDEFVFVGLGSPDDQFATVEQKLIDRIREATAGLYSLETNEISYQGPSIGVLEWQPGDMHDADVTISRADAAMYQDKRQRRRAAAAQSV